VRERILNKYINDLPVRSQWVEQLAENADISPAMMSRAAQVSITIIGESGQSEQYEDTMLKLLGHSLHAMGKSNHVMPMIGAEIRYNLGVVNTRVDLKKLLTGLSKKPCGRLCLYGAPGTGKTQFGKYVAKKLNKPLIVKRASDLLDAYVGRTERKIADMFDQASQDNAVLLLDEADSFLRERKNANRSWEVTQVNELLTQMESFNGLFICSTNLITTLDAASIRRFDLKIEFDYLKSTQVWTLFKQVLHDKGVADIDDHWQTKLSQLSHLTAGDFSTVVRQRKLFDDALDAKILYDALANESSFKQLGQSKSIGFTTELLPQVSH